MSDTDVSNNNMRCIMGAMSHGHCSLPTWFQGTSPLYVLKNLCKEFGSEFVVFAGMKP